MAAGFLALLQQMGPAQTEPAPSPSPPSGAKNPALVPSPRIPWMDQHEGQVAAAKAAKPQLVFLGDSITAGWQGRAPKLWKERYGAYNPVNLGIAGDRTENVLWRIEHGALGGEVQPKLVVLMIGTNNGETPEQIAEAIGAIISEIQKLCPAAKVLLLSVLPRSEKPDHPGRAKIITINSLIAKLDDGQRVFFLPIGEKFLQPDGSISAEIMPDFLHPSAAGYQIWADAMDAKLKELME